MTRNKKYILLSIICIIALILIGTSIGSSNINIGETLGVLRYKIFGGELGNIDDGVVSIIWDLRLPRVLLAFLVGGGLSASGAVVQSVLKNELASPYTLGVSSGAALGAGLIIIFGGLLPIVGNLTLPIVGFLCGLLTVFLVLIFSSKADRSLSNNTIILVGMVFSLFVSALLTTITALSAKNLQSIVLWQMGSFAMKGWDYVYAIIPFLIVGIVGVMMYTREMDILSFGEEQAQSLGVDTKKVKKRLFIFSAVLTGAAVSLSGIIGFVDLIAPHVVRRVFGAKHKLVIPMSILFGGALMVVADIVSRTLIKPAELPIGAITAIIGAPFFCYIYFRKGKR